MEASETVIGGEVEQAGDPRERRLTGDPGSGRAATWPHHLITGRWEVTVAAVGDAGDDAGAQRYVDCIRARWRAAESSMKVILASPAANVADGREATPRDRKPTDNARAHIPGTAAMASAQHTRPEPAPKNLELRDVLRRVDDQLLLCKPELATFKALCAAGRINEASALLDDARACSSPPRFRD